MSELADASPAAHTVAPKTILGQPFGLATLFLTEMWERFTYYGIQAILILYMVAAAAKGGLGLDDHTSSSIYGLFLGSTYLLGLFGGWIADRLLGAQRAVIAGGILIAAGSALLAIGSEETFFLGLLVNAMGVGLLKPNVSAIVASLYPEGGARRDAGFSIFYIGINIGSAIGSFLVPLTAAAFGWHFGFGLPAIFMAVGVAQFLWTRSYLGAAGLKPAQERRGSWTPVVIFLAAVAVIVVLTLTRTVRLDAAALASAASWGYGLLALLYFGYLLFFAGLAAAERRRALVMVALFIASVMFWAGYYQQGGSFNLFAERYTDRHILGWEMPAGVLQAVNPFFVITLAGAFAALWIALGKRGRDPLASAKFGLALVLLGLGFLVMYFAAQHVLAGKLVLPTWLVLTYFLHTCGELCLSPVGLSYMSKLAPSRFVGQAMGVWFLSLALGGNLAGQLTGQYDASHLESLPALFLRIFWYGLIAGTAMLLLTPFVRRNMAGVH
ncbi:MAG TPA: peptide MFS transporter [Steroidobacteraceae bacterium]|nr:peptide MFS transporter [Steroidobacteraceae bacterium]